MSRAHSQSTGLARHAGPYYCLGCGSDWPCNGHLREEADSRRAAPLAEKLDVMTDSELSMLKAAIVKEEQHRYRLSRPSDKPEDSDDR